MKEILAKRPYFLWYCIKNNITPEDAKDLYQEAVLITLLKNPNTDVIKYFQATLRNLVCTFHRKKMYTFGLDLDLANEEEEAEWFNKTVHYKSVLHSLVQKRFKKSKKTTKTYQLIILTMQGYSTDFISKELNWSKRTVKRSKQILIQELKYLYEKSKAT